MYLPLAESSEMHRDLLKSRQRPSVRLLLTHNGPHLNTCLWQEALVLFFEELQDESELLTGQKKHLES